MRILFLLLTMAALLLARENPFEPLVSPQGGFSAKEATNIESTFSKETIKLPSSARKLLKVTVEFQNIDGSVDTMERQVNREIDWHYPILITQTAEKNPTAAPKKIDQKQHLKGTDFISFEVVDNILKIHTKDKLLRDFAITDPSKIVIDLKANRNFNTRFINTDTKIFKEIVIGEHRGFYRVAIELDGLYRYSLKYTDYGYEVRVE